MTCKEARALQAEPCDDFVSAAVRAQTLDELAEAHGEDPHCRSLMESGMAAGRAARGDQRKMNEAYRNCHSVIMADPQNDDACHDAHTYYEAFKWGWSEL